MRADSRLAGSGKARNAGEGIRMAMTQSGWHWQGTEIQNCSDSAADFALVICRDDKLVAAEPD